MKIVPSILDFECSFNHYPKCLNWKTKAAPVVGYYRNDDYIRIDMFSGSHLYNQDEKRYQLTSSIDEKYTLSKVYYSFEEAYQNLILYMEKNKIRFSL